MISFRQKGDFSKVTSYFEKLKETMRLGILDKYGREGVNALSSAHSCRIRSDCRFVVLRDRTFKWFCGYTILQFTCE